MYVPNQYREERPETLAAAMREIQFAALVVAGSDGPQAVHLPTVLKETPEGFVLEGHVARPNPIWRQLAAPCPALAIFQGPQAYVSPSWYATKREHGKVVPTWNYIAVHAHGTLTAVEDGAWLAAHLEDLTRANESAREHPWEVSDAPADFIRNLARAIVGLRLEVARLEGSWKMIQHRSESDRQGTIEGLAASASPQDRAVAEVMQALEAARAQAS